MGFLGWLFFFILLRAIFFFFRLTQFEKLPINLLSIIFWDEQIAKRTKSLLVWFFKILFQFRYWTLRLFEVGLDVVLINVTFAQVAFMYFFFKTTFFKVLCWNKTRWTEVIRFLLLVLCKNWTNLSSVFTDTASTLLLRKLLKESFIYFLFSKDFYKLGNSLWLSEVTSTSWKNYLIGLWSYKNVIVGFHKDKASKIKVSFTRWTFLAR